MTTAAAGRSVRSVQRAARRGEAHSARRPSRADRLRARHRRRDGQPSVRIVLLKGVDDRGFVFYTNYESRKGQELLATQRAALCFHWPLMEMQVRVEGDVDHGERRRGGRLLRVARAREPDRRVGVDPEPADGAARRSRGCASPRSSAIRRCAGSAAAALVGLPRRPARDRILEGDAEPPARAGGLSVARRREAVDGGAALPVADFATEAAEAFRPAPTAVIFSPWLHVSPRPHRRISRRTGRSTRRAPSTTSKDGAPAFSTSMRRATSSSVPTRSTSITSSTSSRSRTISKSRGSRCPVLLRFSDILRSRIESLTNHFEQAREEFAYTGGYTTVYPIKVNQQRHVVEEIVEFGKAAPGRARVRQQAGAAGDSRPRREHRAPDHLQRLQGRGVHAPRPHGPEARAPGLHRHRAAERDRRAAAGGRRDGRDADGRRAHQAGVARLWPLEGERRREVEVRSQRRAAHAGDRQAQGGRPARHHQADPLPSRLADHRHSLHQARTAGAHALLRRAAERGSRHHARRRRRRTRRRLRRHRTRRPTRA